MTRTRAGEVKCADERCKTRFDNKTGRRGRPAIYCKAHTRRRTTSKPAAKAL